MASGIAGTQAGRTQPQTTAEVGSFGQVAPRASRSGFTVSGSSAGYGATIDNPMNAAPGYLRWYDIFFNYSGGANATTTTVAGTANSASSDFLGSGITNDKGSFQANSPAGLVQNLSVKDAYNTSLMNGPGWEHLYLYPLLSGLHGQGMASDVNRWPSRGQGTGTAWATGTTGLATGTATTTTGNFTFHARVPFEIISSGEFAGYGCLSVGNASVQPALHFALFPSASLYATAPGTLPTSTVMVVDEEYRAIPSKAPQLQPPDLGTTLQVQLLNVTPSVASGSSLKIQAGRFGGHILGIAFIARDSTGCRNDQVWPQFGGQNRISLWLDGVQVKDELIETRVDRMYEEFYGLFGSLNVPPTGGVGGRPAGVIAYRFQEVPAFARDLDSLDIALPTTPGTQVEVQCNTWGTFSNGPAQLYALVWAVVPKGQLIQGWRVG